MAGRRSKHPKKEKLVEPRETVELTVPDEEVRLAAARLYGQGYERRQIARILLPHLARTTHFEDGTKRPMEQRLSTARRKLRQWEQSEKFRDLVYNESVVKLDLATPKILSGIAGKARSGRVDAARLVLELTGRHNPKGDQQPAQVVVAINGIPRPMRGDIEIVDHETQELLP